MIPFPAIYLISSSSHNNGILRIQHSTGLSIIGKWQAFYVLMSRAWLGSVVIVVFRVRKSVQNLKIRYSDSDRGYHWRILEIQNPDLNLDIKQI
jgi:hypothetical protein